MGSQEAKALLYGLGAVLCWSTVATAFKVALTVLDTVQLVFYANLTAVVLLLGIVAARGDMLKLPSVFVAHWHLTLMAGALNPVIYYLILFKAYELLPAQVAMTINYTWSIVLVFMTIVFLRQRILPADGIAALVCYSGVFVIATGGDIYAFSQAGIVGLVLALLSTVIWAGYWTLNIADKREPVTGLTLNFIVALPLSAGVCAITTDFSVSLDGLLAATYVGIVEMAVAFVLWSIALKLTQNAARVSNLIFLAPFVSLVIINQVLGEAILPATLVGLLFIIGGLIYQQRAHVRVSKT